ncbi:MAG: signal peptide peptidase SppA [Nanoarchaeota archaeon]
MARRKLEVRKKLSLSVPFIKLPHRNYLLSAAIIIILLVGGFAVMQLHLFSNGNITKPAIAVIPIYGEIAVNGNHEQIKDLIKEANSDPIIKAIILEINSPGGTVVASQEIAQEVEEAKKPTVAFIREVGASGAYWIASEADIIVASEASITGSIGVTSSYLQFAGLFEDYGVTYERLVSGNLKDAGSPYKELTPAERDYLQSKINKIHNLFVSEVAENRKMTKTKVDSLATGEIWLGLEAKEIGLVDEVGDKDAAQKAAEKLIGAKDSRLVEYEPEQSLFSLLSINTEKFAFWMGKGIGQSWSPVSDAKEELTLRAQIY